VDVNNDGFCDREEITNAMKKAGVTFTDEEFDAYFNDIDENGDGKLSLEEIIADFNDGLKGAD